MKYTTDTYKASTFPNAFNAKEAIAALDNCRVGQCRHHMTEVRGDRKIIIRKIGTLDYFADNIGNNYCSRLND